MCLWVYALLASLILFFLIHTFTKPRKNVAAFSFPLHSLLCGAHYAFFVTSTSSTGDRKTKESFRSAFCFASGVCVCVRVMMSGYSPLHPSSFTSPREPNLGGPHGATRSSRAGAASTSSRVPTLDRVDSESYNVGHIRSGTPTHAPLHLTSLIAPNSFARPSYSLGRYGGGSANSFSGGGGSGGATVPSPLRASRSDRRGRGRSSSLSLQRQRVRSPVTRGVVFPAGKERALNLVTPPLPAASQGLTSSGGSLRGRSRQRQEEEKGRRLVSPRSNVVDTSVGGGGAITLSSSPLYSTVTSSASGNGGGGTANTNAGGGGAAGAVSPPSLQVAAGLNPLRPTTVALEGPADASASVSGAGAGAGTVTPNPLSNLLPPGPLKEHCSHCKVEDEALYLCPCGLARYCSTTCQRAHWSFHRTVCCNSVRAVSLSWRRCDWCGLSSQTLRRCGCGFAFYCDVHCQRADWPYHRLVCSTVANKTIVASLLGGPAPRTTREAATQTAHWQINVPVLRSLARPDVSGSVLTPADSRGMSGYAFSNNHASPQHGFTGSGSFGEARFLDGNGGTNGSSFPRSSRTQPPLWEHNSQLPNDSVCSDATSSNSRSTSAAGAVGCAGTAGQHIDPARRLSRSSGVGSVVSPHTPSRRQSRHPHHRPNSFYESLNLTPSSLEPPSPSTMQFRNDANTSPTTSKQMGHSGASFAKHTMMSSAVSGVGSRHSYATSELDGGDAAGTGNGASPASSVATVRDQPSLFAFAATSKRKIESDEQKEWRELCRQFQLERISIELRVLPKLEEEQRVAILKEEVMWCIVTGNRAAKALKQQLLRNTTK
jgi:hypothetical protein